MKNDDKQMKDEVKKTEKLIKDVEKGMKDELKMIGKVMKKRRFDTKVFLNILKFQ